jgi:Flp pilus assembly pilin Flp
MLTLAHRLKRALRLDDGQTLVEYSLILALISIGSIAVLFTLSGKINDVFNTVQGAL